MVNLVIGKKGTGKTKYLIGLANKRSRETGGDVAFLERGPNLMFSLDSAVRLVDTEEFEIVSYNGLYGLISGLVSGNYDFGDIFIDSTFKIAGRNLEELIRLVKRLNILSDKYKVTFYLSLSCDKNDLPEDIFEIAQKIPR